MNIHSRNVLNKSTVHPFHLFQQFLIVVTKTTLDFLQTSRDLFGIVFNLGLLDVNILIEGELTTWFLYFYMPFSNDCNSFQVQKIETFSPENYTKQLNATFNSLFPPKSFTFPNCPLLVATFSMEPFVILHNFDDDIVYDGLEVKIVNQISKTLKLFPKYVQAPDNKGRGTLSKNGSATGAMKMVKLMTLTIRMLNN